MGHLNDKSLRRLTSALLDGDLSEDGHLHLSTLLKGSKQARRFYLRNLNMESALNWEAYSPKGVVTPRQSAGSKPNEEINVRVNNVVPFANPWMVARNWLVGTVAASLALGLWLSTAWRKSVDARKASATVTQNLQPLKTETLERDGKTTAYFYFQLNEEDSPEG